MGATAFLGVSRWNSSTRNHGSTDNRIRSTKHEDTRLCNHQSHYTVIQTYLKDRANEVSIYLVSKVLSIMLKK